ncbi:molybdopterin molybdenumtransferase MoeA [Arcobacter sp. CECT 8989]|uniref:molybdopterin molybdotransferase MoeA n=1 Tax=Arcobacter sp. CECT 8989 TaxID=2044509 RepID=UPI00100A42FD|nr:molybdopterin molybdotransferase MoeA [Arcobacter sp. CECT 8989]RXK01524.1 molybdopterin molybdenumtransferase MoeA [Arcobacter sp. CECT 8989]
MKNKIFISLEEAIKKSLELADTSTLIESIPLEKALGRVLSKDIICIKNLPAFNNSAMDGFAVKASDAGKTLTIKSKIFAGDKGSSASLAENECYKIMTGAKVPDDVDTIIPIELCSDVSETKVTIPSEIKKGNHLRLKGEEQKEGNSLITKGETINFSHITLLASQGITMVEVVKKISIAVISTGNELKEPWETSDDEEIYNCNSYGIISLLNQKGFEASYCGVIPDNLEESSNCISNLKKYDVVISTGGISMGDADFISQAFKENGLKVAFHGVNIKPGKPIMMGKMDNTVVISLPGNPLPALINTYLFILPVLSKKQGSKAFYHDTTFAMNTQRFTVKQGKVNIVLGKVESGNFKVTRENKYGAAMITALYESNALLVTNEERASFEVGEEAHLITFDSNLVEKESYIFN